MLPDPGPGHYPVAQIRQVTPEYFHAMGIPLQEGRYLRNSDEDTLNVVVNRTLARRFFQGNDPVGHNIIMGLLGSRRFNRPIVGVVADCKDTVLQNETWPTFYFVARTTESTILVRSNVSPKVVDCRRPTRCAFAGPEPVGERRCHHGRSDPNVASESAIFHAGVQLAVHACTGLAGIGTYGVVVNQTQRRIPELAIRLALGASRAPCTGQLSARE